MREPTAPFLTTLASARPPSAHCLSAGLKYKYPPYLSDTYEDKVDPWLPMALAVVIGTPLYVVKRMHIIRTDLLILAFILAPLIIFYIVAAIMYGSVDSDTMQHLRDTGWFLTTHGCDSSSAASPSISTSTSSNYSSYGRLLADSSSSSSSSSGSSSSGGSGPFCPFHRVDFWEPVQVRVASLLIRLPLAS